MAHKAIYHINCYAPIDRYRMAKSLICVGSMPPPYPIGPPPPPAKAEGTHPGMKPNFPVRLSD